MDAIGPLHDDDAVSARSRSSLVAPLGLGLGFAGLYAVVAPSLVHQHWDSLAYAHACENDGLSRLWGNHPLGHLIQCSVALTAGAGGRALPVMQIVSAIAGGFAIAALWWVLVRVWHWTPARALAWSALVGGMYGVWHYAGTADIYTIALALWIVAWGATGYAIGGGRVFGPGMAAPPMGDHAGSEDPSSTVVPGSAGAGAVAGICWALATLAHQFGGLVLGIGLGVLAIGSPASTRTHALKVVARIGATGLVTLLAGYAVLAAIALGTLAPGEVATWMVGYGSDPTYGRFLTAEGAAQALAGAFNTIWRWWPPAPPAPTDPVVLLLASGLALLAIGAAVAIVQRRDALLAASAAQVIAGATLVTWWEPWWVGKFWLFLLPPLVVCLDASIETLARMGGRGLAPVTQRGVTTVAAGLLAIVTLVHNGREALAYERRPVEPFEEALARWSATSASDDILIENGRLTAHLLFWVDRPGTLNLYRSLQASGPADPYADLRAQLEAAWAAGRDVWYVPGLGSYYTAERLEMVGTTPAEFEAFFAGFRREGPVFEYREEPDGPVRQVFRLRPDPDTR